MLEVSDIPGFVRYGSFDLERLLDTILPLQDPASGDWGLGIGEGGVEAAL